METHNVKRWGEVLRQRTLQGTAGVGGGTSEKPQEEMLELGLGK